MKLSRHNFRLRFVFFLFGGLAAAAIFIITIFYWLYSTSRQNIVNMWQNNTIQAANDVGYYLTTPMDAVAFTAMKVNHMLKDNTPIEEVGKYLINESDTYSLIIDGNTTGIYGYYKKTYLDGSGWIPDEDYEPTERPWYLKAKEADGEIALVMPYLNLQTHTMMMSVSQLLDDKESVVSMDIFLGGVQTMVKEMVSQDAADTAMVIDKSGFVVAHSDEDEIGKNYNEEGNRFQKQLLKHMVASDENIFELSRSGQKFMIFSNHVNNDWYTVLIMNEHQMLRSLQSIYFLSAVALILMFSAILIVFFIIQKKHREAEQLSREIKAVADIYVALDLIDLKEDTVTCLRRDEKLTNVFLEDFTSYREQILALESQMAEEQSRELMHNFMDIRSLDERLSSLNSISHEFMDEQEQWLRLRFIVVDRDADGRLHHVLLTLESIDEDRKQQEQLRRLSETDMMTGVRNRGSGERMIRNEISMGTTGMFCLLDADHFKSVNDNYGHTVGDKVIIAIAKAMQTTFRDSDIVFRLGGDEFAVFAKGVVTEEIGNRILERLFKNIDAISIPELDTRKIHVSVGAAFYSGSESDSFDSVYERADSGTYQSKEREGNAVTFVH